MRKLFEQIIKFGVVGIISFFVDFAVYTLICNVLHIHYMIAGVCGFVISVIVNYVLSMKFVFRSKDDMSKTKEFIIFVVLSVIGLGVNSLVLYLCIDVVYRSIVWLQNILTMEMCNMAAKIIATGIVMIYNFVTRKIFLEKKEA